VSLCVAANFLRWGKQKAPVPCNCACCTTQPAEQEDGPYHCGTPILWSDSPSAFFAACDSKCTTPGDFIIDSPRGDEIEIKRFCLLKCEPVSQTIGAGAECIPIQEATVRRTYPNTTHSAEGGEHRGRIYANELGNGNVPVVSGDVPESCVGDDCPVGYACAMFPGEDVCEDFLISCRIKQGVAGSCSEKCATKGLHCLEAYQQAQSGCGPVDSSEDAARIAVACTLPSAQQCKCGMRQ